MISRHFLDPAYRELSEEEFSAFQKLYKIFVQKNGELNLSAIRDESGIWEKHFFDSLLGAEFITESHERILDLGSGGGFPALPLAVVFPKQQFFPLDSVGKKMKAVSEMAASFGLNNMFPITERAEVVGRDKKQRESFDVVTVRAVASLSTSLELSLPLVKIKGIVLLYRTPSEEENEDVLAEAFGGLIRSKKKCALPNGDPREIWEIVKIGRTDPRFPRLNGIPKKNPLTLRDVTEGI